MKLQRIVNVKPIDLADTVTDDELTYLLNRLDSTVSTNSLWCEETFVSEGVAKPMALMHMQLFDFVALADKLFGTDTVAYYKSTHKTTLNHGTPYYVSRNGIIKGEFPNAPVLIDRVNPEVLDYLVPIHSWILGILHHNLVLGDADLVVQYELIDFLVDAILPQESITKLRAMSNCRDIWLTFMDLTGTQLPPEESITDPSSYVDFLLEKHLPSTDTLVSEYMRRLEGLEGR